MEAVAQCVTDCRAGLGESPVWDAASGVLWWVDILGPTLHRLHVATGQHSAIALPEMIGFIVPRADRGFTAGFHDSLARLQTDPLRIDPLFAVEGDQPENRINDGKTDPMGRLWFGTMQGNVAAKTGALYRLDRWGPILVERGFYASNGPTFSPDGSLLYRCDTMGRVIRCHTVGQDGGLGPGSVFVDGNALGWPADWLPDGMTTDAAGGIWVAIWGGGRVIRFDASGQFDWAIMVPAAQVTSCTFGGADLCDLYITAAAVGVMDAAQSQAGRVFVAIGAGQGMATTVHSDVLA